MTVQAAILSMNNAEINALLKTFLLLYADDTVICSETPEGSEHNQTFCDCDSQKSIVSVFNFLLVTPRGFAKINET